MVKIECQYCGGDLEILPQNHPEFFSITAAYDGTRKWYLCSNCEGVYGKDKVLNRWYISPGTYTKMIEKGIIEDRLKE